LKSKDGKFAKVSLALWQSATEIVTRFDVIWRLGEYKALMQGLDNQCTSAFNKQIFPVLK